MLHVNPHDSGDGNHALFVKCQSEPHERRQRELNAVAIVSYSNLETIIVTKMRAEFTRGDIDVLQTLVDDIRQGHRAPCKFLVFNLGEFDHAAAASGFSTLLADIADLIVTTPVITVAWARGRVAGPDLELAFACSVIVGEPQARFRFDIDLVDSLRTYSVLAHKIGFVRAERILENAAELDVEQMNDLMLLTAVPKAEGDVGVQEFVKARARKHNASWGIYRAQRLAMPAV